MGLDEVKEIARMTGGTITEVSGPLPDGSGFAVVEMPLPKDHWILKPLELAEPPMPFRMGENEHCLFTVQREGKIPHLMSRNEIAEKIREIGKYALRASIENSDEVGFDPDALLQNLIVGFLGYWTEDGFSHC